ncbi:hypothetical protein JK364_16360 [Streptomyces sp. 110]|uniref:Integral membrane protein n=1 Tax=Streptomyces endocoffeicus TaxID=2898945 RepID=A0ABS1PPA4_9ACTN|nr:hypothetical protein [Streptomyces endocoffeicus]MBL1113955.1 hypothetical protein [Streptomyces endocoffeicus]
MTDDANPVPPDPPGDAAAAGTSLRLPAWLSGRAVRFRDALTDDRLLALLILVDLVTLLTSASIWLALGGDAGVVGVTAGALLAFVAAMLPLIRRRDAEGERPLWPPLILVVIPLAVLIVGLPAWGVWVYLDSRPVDMSHRFTLSPARPVENGDTVVASAHTDDPHPRLTIRFALTQHNLSDPTCTPGSKLTVTLPTGAGQDLPQTRAAGETFVLDLGEDMKDIRLTVRLIAEQNCALDLSVTSAHLDE